MSRGATLATHRLREPHPVSNQPLRLGFPHLAGLYRPGGSAFSSTTFWSCRDVDGFLMQRWHLIPPGCGATSTLSREATLATFSLHEPQPISNQPVGLGFPHLAGLYRPGGSAFSSTISESCTDVERFLMQRWLLMRPGCGATSALARGATLAACWPNEPQPNNNHPEGLGFPRLAGQYRPGRS